MVFLNRFDFTPAFLAGGGDAFDGHLGGGEGRHVGHAVFEGGFADGGTIGQRIAAGAGGVDHQLNLFVHDEVEDIRAAFADFGHGFALNAEGIKEALGAGGGVELESEIDEGFERLRGLFVLDGEVVTPALQGSILGGITRMSCIEILKSWGMNVSERRISIDELSKAYDEGRLLEAFGSGTAAVASE